jgi:hypothetical protein
MDNTKADVTKVGHFQMVLRGTRKGVVDHVEPFYNSTGCVVPPKGHPKEDELWPKRCIYSKIVRSLVTGGPGGRLTQDSAWLQQHYSGSTDRFHAVMAINKNRPTPVFDAVVHLRTIALVEDLDTEDGNPVDTAIRAEAFMRTSRFGDMLACFAAQLAEGLVTSAPGARTGVHGAPRALPPPHDPREVAIFLATDAADMKAEFARRLQEALVALLPGDQGWTVAVDFFKKECAPANFFVWTFGMPEMKAVRPIPINARVGPAAHPFSICAVWV